MDIDEEFMDISMASEELMLLGGGSPGWGKSAGFGMVICDPSENQGDLFGARWVKT